MSVPEWNNFRLAAKLHAILFRKYAKGRDYYDLLWFLTRKTLVNKEYFPAAIKKYFSQA